MDKIGYSEEAKISKRFEEAICVIREEILKEKSIDTEELDEKNGTTKIFFEKIVECSLALAGCVSDEVNSAKSINGES